MIVMPIGNATMPIDTDSHVRTSLSYAKVYPNLADFCISCFPAFILNQPQLHPLQARLVILATQAITTQASRSLLLTQAAKNGTKPSCTHRRPRTFMLIPIILTLPILIIPILAVRRGPIPNNASAAFRRDGVETMFRAVVIAARTESPLSPHGGRSFYACRGIALPHIRRRQRVREPGGGGGGGASLPHSVSFLKRRSIVRPAVHHQPRARDEVLNRASLPSDISISKSHGIALHDPRTP